MKPTKPKLSPLWKWVIGKCNMCRQADVCPRFERRSINGKSGACVHCEYLKKERKQLIVLRITTILAFVAFLVSTYVRFC